MTFLKPITAWKLNKIIFFEYLLLCHKKYGDNFFQSTSDFVENTLASKNSILKLVKEFEKNGFIKVERHNQKTKGKDFRNKYSFNFDFIMKSFRQIYNFGDQEEKEIQENEKILMDWYLFLKDNQYRKSRLNKAKGDHSWNNISLVYNDE